MRLPRAVFVFLTLFLSLLPTSGCIGDRRSGVTAIFQGEGVRPHPPFSMEVVSTVDARAKGLMFRKEMAADHGMLFLFPREEQLSFWMKNTYIPLDIIFIGRDWRVVGVVENAVPLTEEPRRVDGVSQRVIELNAGKAHELGIATGTQVVISGALPQPF